MIYITEDILAKIEQLKKDEKFDEALDLVNSLLTKDPLNEEMLYQVSDIQYRKGEIQAAERPIDFILKYKGNSDPISFYIKGVFEMEKTNWQQAKDYFKKALQLSNFENPEILRVYGLSEYWSGNREKGIDFVQKAFDISKFDAEIIYNLIELNLLEHKFEDAKNFIGYYHQNYKRLETFDKDINFYDKKIKLFEKYLENLNLN